jgi:hypothetical protein
MQTTYTKEEVVERGKALYDRQIRPLVEADNVGRFVVIDIETGDYEITVDEDATLTAADNLHARHPNAHLFIQRIGYPAATFMGGAVEPFTR